MSQFGLTHDQLRQVKQILQDVFGLETDLKVFIFGSRATGRNKKNSDIDLAFKSKNEDLEKKIPLFKDKLEESTFPFKVDAVNWDKLLEEYLPLIKKQKVPFWDSSERLTPWRQCPLGYHWVQEHIKQGNADLTDSHCRKNTNKYDVLYKDEILKITETQAFRNPPAKASTQDLDFKGLENKYDHLINGWCAYWNDIIRPKDPIHPDFIKVLIATESSFVENPKRDAKHTAIGITQIMPKTITLLSSRSKELKDHYLELKVNDVFDPTVNICASIRWLFRKYELAKRKKRNLLWLDVLEEYKGILNARDTKSMRIRNDLKALFYRLRPNEKK